MKKRKTLKKPQRKRRAPRAQPLPGRRLRPKPDDIVSFTVLCTPRSGVGLDQFRRLQLDNIREYLPDEATKRSVIESLKGHGFTVYTKYPSPVVSASGALKHFENVFHTKLVKVQRIDSSGGERIRQDYYIIDPASSGPDVRVVPGALSITLVEPPLFCSAFPPPTKKTFRLRHAVDIAIATRAALVHRHLTPLGKQSTGGGVRVVVVDSGFHLHPYFVRNGYSLTAELAEGAQPPAMTDPTGHGTRMVANVFSCAPDATVTGVKSGDPIKGLDCALALAPDVVSCSWLFNLVGETSLPAELVNLRVRVLDVLAAGVPIVFGVGNHGQIGFPAMMPEVIAVGGVDVAANESIKASSVTSSFNSKIFPGRTVPDVCGVASDMALPTAPDDGDTDQAPWRFGNGGASAAAAQVAGILALLRQKHPQLSPQQLKDVLMQSATDVTSGKSANNHVAGPNGDLATGAGMVDAFKAWDSV